MNGWHKAVEKRLQEAIDSGAFDDLPGKGKPLSLEKNPFVDPEWRLAHHLLRANGFSLPWMQERQEIEAQLAQARLDLARTRRWREEQPASRQAWADTVWKEAVSRFHARLEALNRRLANYNLQVPTPRFQRALLDAQAEVAAVQAGELPAHPE